MKIKELKEEIKDLPDDWDVKVRYQTYPRCRCDKYCYCSSDEHIEDFYISKNIEYNRKTKKQEIVGIEFTI